PVVGGADSRHRRDGGPISQRDGPDGDRREQVHVRGAIFTQQAPPQPPTGSNSPGASLSRRRRLHHLPTPSRNPPACAEGNGMSLQICPNHPWGDNHTLSEVEQAPPVAAATIPASGGDGTPVGRQPDTDENDDDDSPVLQREVQRLLDDIA